MDAIGLSPVSPAPSIAAIAWARLIANEYRAVAPAYQLSAAREILSPTGLMRYQDVRINPIGPSPQALLGLLNEEIAGRLAEMEVEGPASSWDAWTDCLTFAAVEC